jgi:hypothetical protein
VRFVRIDVENFSRMTPEQSAGTTRGGDGGIKLHAERRVAHRSEGHVALKRNGRRNEFLLPF